jgi:outer membrane beta-barrel protein
MKRYTSTLVALVIGTLVFGMAQDATAQKSETMQKRLEKSKTVRRQKMMRAGRMEVGLSFGSTLGDTYKRSYPINVLGNYYLSDEFGVGLSAFFAPASETALAEEIRAIRPNRVGGEESFSAVTLGAGVDAIYTPLHGKLSLLGISALRYDLSVTGGVHLLQITGAQSDGFKPAPSLGISSHFFIDDQLAVSVFYKNFAYSSANRSLIVSGSPVSEEAWSLNSFGGISFSFFTGKPTVGYE